MERKRAGNRVRVAGGCSGLECGRSLDQEGCLVVSARWSLLLAARGKTSAITGRWAEGMKSKRSVSGGEGESHDRKRMAA